MEKTHILAIDLGSSKVCSLIAEVQGEVPQIVGVGIAHSREIQKGAIKAIDLASKALKESLNQAKQMAGVDINKAYIALSGNCVKGENITEQVKLQENCEIGKKEMHRIMRQTDFKAHHEIIPNNYELVQILPHSFRIDNEKFVDNPLGMIGSQLEVSARVIYAHNADLANLKKVVQSAGVEVAGIVLNAYVGAFAVLDDAEKRRSVCYIDIGSDSCNFAIYHDNAMQYDDFIPDGSWNITDDISASLNTAMETAEYIKKKFAKLSDLTPNDKEMVLDKVPNRSGETRNVDYKDLHSIAYDRAFDMLQKIKQSIEKSDFSDKLGAGIVITGGMSYMKGLKDLAQKVFPNMSVRIAKPKAINKSFEMIRKNEAQGLLYACFSTAIGLVLYASGRFTNYELDMNRKMSFKNSTPQVAVV